MKRRAFAIAAIFDTETCNLGTTASDAHAIPILYIDNDIRDIDLIDYEPERDDHVKFYRFEEEYIGQLREYVEWGKMAGVVPIVCAYNLMFDLQSLMESLSNDYEIEANAQSSTNVYTIDIYENDAHVLRFWDCFHLDMRGLAKMGDVAGLPKATGSWDYSLIRTPSTELSDEELYYAKRDVQVIPAFLRFLLRTNDWMKQSDLGSRVLTKTSLVRQMARREIGSQRVRRENGKDITVEKMFLDMCRQEQPRSFDQYAVRKSCFRGGYTFTSAAFASTIQHNVVSVDVTSMHHTFINGRFVPNHFKVMGADALQRLAERVLSTTREHVVESYHKPFDCAFHARIRFTNIRLRGGSAFEAWGIALEPLSKFKRVRDVSDSEARDDGENSLISDGWHDTFTNGSFAFGKLYRADEATLHVNEVELWSMSRVYEWDEMRVIYGDGTMSFCRPPDYVTLQSNVLYEMKDSNKFISNHYHEGEPYPFKIPKMVPEGYRDGLLSGTLSHDDWDAYYISDTKGKFNGIYGTMAQDVYKPSYRCVNGSLEVDRETIVSRSNWKDRQPKSCRVLYTYGMRIVAGSRLHMVLAIERVWEEFGSRARVLGGDTDSMKISVDGDVTDAEMSRSLHVFEEMSKSAIDETMRRVRTLYPTQASSLRGIGGFEIENEGNHYVTHLELWNKCRVSIGSRGDVHVTCAGLSRPSDAYHIGRFIHEMVECGNDAGTVLQACMGYNVFVSHDICHALESSRPGPYDRFVGDVTDHLGVTSHVDVHEVVCLYPVGRWLGETLKDSNRITVDQLGRWYDRDVDTRERHLVTDGSVIEVLTDLGNGLETTMIGDSEWLS